MAASLVTLGLFAARIPLAARAGNAPEHLALSAVLIAQAIVVALIFPVLLADFRMAAFALATTPPMIQLAGILSDARISTTWIGIAVMEALLAGLWLTAGRLRTDRQRLWGIASVSAAMIGGLAIAYLRAEFSRF